MFPLPSRLRQCLALCFHGLTAVASCVSTAFAAKTVPFLAVLRPAGSDGASKWPSGALAPHNGTDATYSGLLECPLTTRIKKTLTGGGWSDSFSANIVDNHKGPSCPKTLDTAADCFAAAKKIGISASAQVTTGQGRSAELPGGCSVQVDGTKAQVYFNTNSNSTAGCGAGVDTVEGVQVRPSTPPPPLPWRT